MAKFVPFIIKTDGSQNISVKIVRMKKSDAVQTEKEPVWQTSWLSDYIQDDAFEKYALKTSDGEAGRSRSRQRFRSWQSMMSGTMELVHCRVLAEHRVMNFLVRQQ